MSQTSKELDVIFGVSVMPQYKMPILPLTDKEIKQMRWAQTKEDIKEAIIGTSLIMMLYISLGSMLYFVLKAAQQ